MTVAEAIRAAIDSGSHINAEGCYLLALRMENQTE